MPLAICMSSLGFLGGSDAKESAYSRTPGFDPCVGKTPWRRKWQTTLAFLPEEFHGPDGLQSLGSKRVGHD